MPIILHRDARALGVAVAHQIAHDFAAGFVTSPFRLAVPGGRSPVAVFEVLARDGAIDWGNVEILFADERGVPPEHPDSNYRLVAESLLARLGKQKPRVRRMHGESADLEAAARAYESDLGAPLDVLMLGVGEDGHIASLFPGSPLLGERVRRAAAVFDSPKPPARRLTITPRVIAEARRVVVIAAGAGKRDAVARALAADGAVVDCPARLAFEADWHVDAEAAAGLPRA